jgi:hypothetical protein
MVVEGGATVLVSCGRSGREVAIGARDAGLDLSNVVVCRDAFSACELLSCRLAPGDTLLLLGVDQVACERLIQLLDNRQTFPLRAAA